MMKPRVIGIQETTGVWRWLAFRRNGVRVIIYNWRHALDVACAPLVVAPGGCVCGLHPLRADWVCDLQRREFNERCVWK
jgi:hypothetical protein